MPEPHANQIDLIEVVAGPSRGTRLKLAGRSLTIGSGRSNALRVKGKFVADVHIAIDATPDGQWVIRNQSPDGILMNKRKVDRAVVVAGDHVQLGSETLIKFSVSSKFEPLKWFQKSPARSGGQPSNTRTILIAAGAIVYLVVMAYFLLMDVKPAAVAVDLDAKAQKRLLNASVGCIMTPVVAKDSVEKTAEGAAAEKSAEGVAAVSPTLGDERGLYDQVQLLVAKDNTGEAEAITKQLVATVEEHLYRAWVAKSQGSVTLAREEYSRIARMIPNIDCAISKYAIQQRRALTVRTSTRR